MSQKEQYKEAAKNTAVLGSAQILQMLVTLIRAKMIVVLLGSTGMGVNSLFQSAVNTIQQMSSLGVFQSSVRELAQANEKADKDEIGTMRKVLNVMALSCGILGTFICACGSSWLSQFCFGNKEYTWLFVFVSLALLFWALSNSKVVLMQATRSLTYLAKASIIGALMSLIAAFPIFYFMRIDGVVPAIVVGYLIFYLVNKYFADKIKIEKVDNVSLSVVVERGKPILKLGFVLMISSLIMALFIFILNGFISRIGGVKDVGFYQAAVAICMQSIIVVNTTLSADYFPRLSAVCHDEEKLNEVVSQQGELITMIVAPISITLVLLAPLVVTVLLSNEFQLIVPMLRWMSLALIFRGIWYVFGFVALAKGDKKTYLIYDAFIGHGLSFVLNCIAYYFWGLKGLGISFVIGSFLMAIILTFVVVNKYDYKLNYSFFKLVGMFISLSIVAMLSATFIKGVLYMVVAFVILCVTMALSYRLLDQRINISALIKNKFKK